MKDYGKLKWLGDAFTEHTGVDMRIDESGYLNFVKFTNDVFQRSRRCYLKKFNIKKQQFIITTNRLS